MKAVIFGASGQDGHYLIKLCEANEIEVLAISRSEGPWRSGNVANYSEVESLILAHRPNYVFHLAANSTTRHDALFENNKTILDGTTNILEACHRHCPNARIFLTGSGLQFENSGVPISEFDSFAPSSPYAVARIASVLLARYFRARGLKVYVGYLFHHDSPLRKPNHVAKAVAAAAARISKGSSEVLEIGDSDVEKEWTFAGDVVDAIWLLVNQEKHYEATIGSGRSYTIRRWAEECFKRVGLNAADHTVAKKNYVAEYRRLVSSAETISSLGWEPKVSISELAAIMMDAETELSNKSSS